jgi:hypothetical protein
MTKATLFALLTSSVPPRCCINGVRGVLKSIEREDGSGNTFNVTINSDFSGKAITVFVRFNSNGELA